MQFRHILSLGGHCEPSWHLRRTGRLRDPSPFDWLVAPLASVIEIVADGGRGLGTEFRVSHDGKSVRCARYGVLYHHEFPRADDGLVQFSEDAVARCRSKLAHKMQRFMTACSSGEPTLFLRMQVATDLAWDPVNAQRGALSDVGRVADCLSTRFPDLPFRLLFIEVAGEEAARDIDHPLITTTALPRATEGFWSASDANWDALLSTIAQHDDRAPEVETLYGL